MMPWLKALAVKDFRSIRGPVPVSLDAPVVLIQGANGAGKTSLLSALELALTRSVASLERFDRDYIRHLPHKDSPHGRGHVTLTATGLDGLGEAVFTVTGSAIEGGPALLSPSDAHFFVERCYLAQATLGRLLEIYEYQDTRRTNSPLTQFVKELLGLEALDALIEGLHSVGNVRRLRAFSVRNRAANWAMWTSSMLCTGSSRTSQGSTGRTDRWSAKKRVSAAVFRLPALSIARGFPPLPPDR